MSAISDFVREHVWDTCLVCGCDYAVKRNGRLHVHGSLNNRCPGSYNDGVRVATLRAVSSDPEAPPSRNTGN